MALWRTLSVVLIITLLTQGIHGSFNASTPGIITTTTFTTTKMTTTPTVNATTSTTTSSPTTAHSTTTTLTSIPTTISSPTALLNATTSTTTSSPTTAHSTTTTLTSIPTTISSSTASLNATTSTTTSSPTTAHSTTTTLTSIPTTISSSTASLNATTSTTTSSPTTAHSTTTTLTSIPTTISSSTASPPACGIASLNYYRGGEKSLASEGAWPWMASLQRNGTHVCGGTLVSEKHVLSSADCFSSSPNASDWTVVLGSHKQNGSNPNSVSISVRNITLSKESENNIAVLELSQKPPLSDYIQPICIETPNLNISTQCWASGWGSGGGVEQALQHFNTSIMDCGSASSSNSSICTGIMPLEQSHKGGPLMCKIGQSWFHVAALSLLSNNTVTTRASTDVHVFTKTSHFASFLKTILNSNAPVSSSLVTAVPSSLVTSVLLLVLLSFHHYT
ncbi:uncharacterized protein LOC103042929 isoform X3 [Astyanax mexicanus]|uniref:uncharacterized protein LOC103042929 isoform X3 n=1 Tax=Astyanax mexicanus TaxID=7994 RepID=UPI0020CB0960|nr:uncharacterized protein LOC103042929 isoform X3 [Astyanax mexicanus]